MIVADSNALRVASACGACHNVSEGLLCTANSSHFKMRSRAPIESDTDDQIFLLPLCADVRVCKWLLSAASPGVHCVGQCLRPLMHASGEPSAFPLVLCGNVSTCDAYDCDKPGCTQPDDRADLPAVTHAAAAGCSICDHCIGAATSSHAGRPVRSSALRGRPADRHVRRVGLRTRQCASVWYACTQTYIFNLPLASGIFAHDGSFQVIND